MSAQLLAVEYTAIDNCNRVPYCTILHSFSLSLLVRTSWNIINMQKLSV